MKEKRLVGISLYIMFLPIITFLLVKVMLSLNLSFVQSPAHPFRFLYNYTVFGGSGQTSWLRVSLYIALGMWVSYLSNAARLGAIALTGFTAIWGIVKLFTVYSSVGAIAYQYVLKTYGRDDTLLPAFVQMLFLLANAFVVFYLTRPKVKALFQ